MLKLSTVAAIGAHFVKEESWTFETATSGSTMNPEQSKNSPGMIRPVLVNGHFTKYYWTKEVNRDKPALTHLWVAIVSRVRLAQYRKMISETDNGNVVISSDTDEIVLAQAPRTALGPYKYKGMIREYIIPASRWAWKDGKIKAPGLAEADRGSLDDLTAEEYGILISLRGPPKTRRTYDPGLTQAFREGWPNNGEAEGDKRRRSRRRRGHSEAS
jgi:hypothetical protein